ncbi:MAG: ABC transporter ATP-binding protein [Candidatus Omnitrophica bacterium]|nr:ABC transporter ATP-binding protein [Candidatus Omnitrophota bacterium]
MKVIVEVKGLKKQYFAGRGLFRKEADIIRAVDGLDLTLYKGKNLGLVGESGCGKTTAGKLILGLIRPDSGSVKINGTDVFDKCKKKRLLLKKSAQIIFQDPYGSLNPRMKIGDIVLEGVDIFRLAKKEGREKRLKKLLGLVGLPYFAKDKYPHQFSGGERQRIAIARALSTEPEFIVCDEAVSSLDMSIRAQILNLLKDLQDNLGLSYLFISHDLNVVKYISDQVAVMYRGRIVEYAESSLLYQNPRHPYTKLLLSANLSANPDERKRKFILPELDDKLTKEYKETPPPLEEVEPNHFVQPC